MFLSIIEAVVEKLPVILALLAMFSAIVFK